MKLISRLEAESGAWERARRLRRYLRAARRSLTSGARIEAMLDGQSVDLLAFGEEFANQLDPLHPAERSQGYFSRQDPYATGQTYETDDAKLRRFLARWLGGDWRQGDKLGREAARPPTVSPGAMLFNDGD